MSNARGRAVWFAFVCIFAFGTLLRCKNFTGFSPLYDENITQAVVSHILHGHLDNNWRYTNVPTPFRIDFYNFSSYFYVLAVFRSIADRLTSLDPLYVSRLFSSLCGSASLFLLFRITRAWFCDEVALAATAVFAVIPLLVQDSHYARPEAFLVLLFLFTLDLLLTLRRKGFQSKRFILVCLIIGFMTAAKLSFLPLIVLPFISIFKQLRDRQIGLVKVCVLCVSGVLAGAIVGVPFGFVHPGAYLNGIEYLRNQYAGTHLPHSMPNGERVGPMVVLYFWQTMGGVLIGATLLGAFLLLRQRKFFESAVLIGPLVFYFWMFSIQRAFFERNFSHVLPLIAILAGVALVAALQAGTKFVKTEHFRLGFLILLIGMAIWTPCRISGKLVFVAMSGTYRNKLAAEQMRFLGQIPYAVMSTDVLLVPPQRDQLIDLVRRVNGAVCVCVTDYQDPFTRRNMDYLKSRVAVRPLFANDELFPELMTSTIQTYHAWINRYLLLSPLPSPSNPLAEPNSTLAKIDGPATPALKPVHINTTGWVINGVYPGLPAGPGGVIYGSWGNGGDATVGVYEAQYRVPGSHRIRIPIETGPNSDPLHIMLRDDKSGAVIAKMQPPPVLSQWVFWQVALDHEESVTLVAVDSGKAWGQWMAVGTAFE